MKTQSRQPGLEHKMDPPPKYIDENYQGSDKLLNKVCLITGGDSGIGRAIAVLFAAEGAKVVFNYLDEDRDAEETLRLIDEYSSTSDKGMAIKGDLRKVNCDELINQIIRRHDKLDILINNAGEQHPSTSPVGEESLRSTFETNFFAMVKLTNAALGEIKSSGGRIINTTSVVAYQGRDHLVDYGASKGAVVAYTRSLASQLAPDVLVNAVAPGPIVTPLIPATFSQEHLNSFGKDTPLGRPGQPCEVAPCYLFLSSPENSYMTGQVLHPNGGEPVSS